ncbi:RNA-binding protein [Bathymodiolus platifrons methanotrophic gill symbiont]|uniref:ribosome assembly RNA-binding protein YhbY n=1 Tax=Bathymodiolus platifrons methanotrophic gill symbiont TaxID=113268 RepID=UPI000B408A42|nr:ribosome assembly RNA-binding protein YhbY [Bathymodiolus platifrons methanotrophic gill symbiont]MCK5870799.1 ribosome assembly RNA-binding protein YhbY [Methyloprofundus sp.]TXK98122.1 RNA-binding protein [Methylococcaceae bacterium CS4]TXK98826.1 RNA-binding protein [Methylococcaceae bacterium HT1]TXK99630.1 RNA-binding protein [Methylococcaceae bacterium CS5]TXL05287.1 RNA-binding protein [Methylococcaceae bacterium CS1]TXL08001.1 RNA-binding protein [Methylococcaceae bacterium CS3]TX
MNSEQLKQLKTLAHELNPVIMIGQAGLTEAVLKEIELALDTHELIKIKIRAEREQRKQIQQQICTETKAEPIQSIGQIIVIYRKKPEQTKKKQAPHTRRRDGTR